MGILKFCAWADSCRNQPENCCSQTHIHEVTPPICPSLSTGAKLLIDAKAQLTILGTEMDYVESKLSSEFIFNNPNVKGTCGCGESFTV